MPALFGVIYLDTSELGTFETNELGMLRKISQPDGCGTIRIVANFCGSSSRMGSVGLQLRPFAP